MYASFSELIRDFPLRPSEIARELGVTRAVVWRWMSADLIPPWQFSNFVRLAERIQHPKVTYKVMCDLAEMARIKRGYRVGKEIGDDARVPTQPLQREHHVERQR